MPLLRLSSCTTRPQSHKSSEPSPKLAPQQSFTVKGTKLDGRSIYLDMMATTAVDPRVLDAMMPFFTEQFGNPHSRTHLFGWETEDAVEKAREVG